MKERSGYQPKYIFLILTALRSAAGAHLRLAVPCGRQEALGDGGGCCSGALCAVCGDRMRVELCPALVPLYSPAVGIPSWHQAVPTAASQAAEVQSGVRV